MERKKLNNTTAGLGALLQGIYTGIQDNRAHSIQKGQLANQTRTTDWADPNRPLTDMDVLKAKQNPLYQILSQLVPSVPTAQNGYNIPPVATPAPGANPPVQANQQTQAMTNQNMAPIQPIDWASATQDDFLGWQAEMKKRQQGRV